MSIFPKIFHLRTISTWQCIFATFPKGKKILDDMEEGSDRANDKTCNPCFHSVPLYPRPLLNTGILPHFRHWRVSHLGVQLHKAVSLPQILCQSYQPCADVFIPWGVSYSTTCLCLGTLNRVLHLLSGERHGSLGSTDCVVSRRDSAS